MHDSNRAYSIFETQAVAALLHHRSVQLGNAADNKWALSGIDPEELPADFEAEELETSPFDSRAAAIHGRGTFDLIVLSGLEHSPSTEEMLSAAALLSTKGRLIVIDLFSEGPFGGEGEVIGLELPSRCRFEVSLAEAGFRVDRALDLAIDTSRNSATRGGTSVLEVKRLIEDGSLSSRGYILSKDPYRIRDCNADDVAKILSLFERCFYHRRPIDHWLWKYQSNPWGNDRISLAIDSTDDELVGQYCAYPVPFVRQTSDGPERFLAHQVGDTMTAKEVRGVGRGPTSLLARSARHFYARFCHGQVAFNYGFNTGNIREFSKRFVGALDVMPAPYRVLPLPPPDAREEPTQPSLMRRALNLLKTESILTNRAVRIERIDSLDQRFDRLLAETLPDYRLLVERSSRYLEWRYLGAPDVDYRLYAALRGNELLGWGVFRQRDQHLVWGDALVRRQDASIASALLEQAVSDAPGATAVTGWFSDRPTWWSDTLTAIGFEEREEPDDLAMVVVPFSMKQPVALLQEELYLSMGDGDLF